MFQLSRKLVSSLILSTWQNDRIENTLFCHLAKYQIVTTFENRYFLVYNIVHMVVKGAIVCKDSKIVPRSIKQSETIFFVQFFHFDEKRFCGEIEQKQSGCHDKLSTDKSSTDTLLTDKLSTGKFSTDTSSTDNFSTVNSSTPCYSFESSSCLVLLS